MKLRFIEIFCLLMKKSFIIMCTIFAAALANAQAAYQIYPVPQRQDLRQEKVSFTKQVTIVAEPGIDEVTIGSAFRSERFGRCSKHATRRIENRPQRL